VLTMLDDFTKWAEAIPIEDISAKGVADAVVEHWVARYGVPDKIHSDQGVQFTSNVFTHMIEALGIKTTTTPAYNPRSNKVERMHRVLGEILRSDQTGPPEDWVRKLPMAMFAYRTTTSTVTGVTPFQAMFGVNSRVPLDVIFPLPNEDGSGWPQHVVEKRKQLHDIYSFMRKHQKVAVQRATAYHSGRVSKTARVEIGELVYYLSPRVVREKEERTSRKLAILWTGPFRVVDRPSNCLVTIYPAGKWAKNPKAITTTLDKVKVIRGNPPEREIHPRVQVDLDDVEEDLEDFGEYIRTIVGAEPADLVTGDGNEGPEVAGFPPAMGSSSTPPAGGATLAEGAPVDYGEWAAGACVPPVLPAGIEPTPSEDIVGSRIEPAIEEDGKNVGGNPLQEGEGPAEMETDKDQQIPSVNITPKVGKSPMVRTKMGWVIRTSIKKAMGVPSGRVTRSSSRGKGDTPPFFPPP